jgi:hypothetical protein
MPDWSLLQQPDYVRSVLGGYQAGQQIKRQRQTDGALSLYASNPAAGTAALMQVDPGLALQLGKAAREQATFERENKVRESLAMSVDENGNIDPKKARSAFGQAGDVAGLMAFDKAQIGNDDAVLEHAHKLIDTEAQLLGSATDQASYTAARAKAGQLGIDISQVPEAYDPKWVQQQMQNTLSAKERLDFQFKGRSADLADKREAREAAQGAGNLAVSQGNLAMRQKEFNRGPSPSGASGSAPASVSRTINGTTYYQVGGKWFDNPEGR